MIEKVTFTKKVTCPECGGSGAVPIHDPDDPHYGGECSSCPIPSPCPKCHGEGTIKKKVKFKLWETCPTCKGNKIIPNKAPFRNMIDCPTCNAVPGKSRHYITPAEWEEQMGEPLGDDAPIWCKSRESESWIKARYSDPEYFYHNDNRILLRIPSQPAPDNDWRP